MESRSLTETPTWAVAAVVAAMLSTGLFFHTSLKLFGKWLKHKKKKAMTAALEKIKDELMVFGVMSLLMAHAMGYAAKICIKSSVTSNVSQVCWSSLDRSSHLISGQYVRVSSNDLMNVTLAKDHCPEGHEPFASKESLEKLHRLMFFLAVTHISYSFAAVALAVTKISSWRSWENLAKSLVSEREADVSSSTSAHSVKMRRLASFIVKHASHPWSQRRVFEWLLCFTRQFWSSLSQSDYMALRLGFITNHQLPLTYDFHSYMLRSMEEEFHHIVGISVPLWIYAILCIFMEFHDTHVYFWLSFVPAIAILLLGAKLHRVMVKLAVEIIDACPSMGSDRFNLRDDLFWFGKPQLLLWLIHLISFQNAFEMATYIWSMWEINDSSCFMDNMTFMVVRLSCGLITQVWFSYNTFPLYVIVTQMGSKFRKSVISENVWSSLSQWQKRVRERRRPSSGWRMKIAFVSSSDSSDEASSSKGKAMAYEEMSNSDNEESDCTPTPRDQRSFGHDN